VFLILTPIVAYVCMLVTVGILVSMGYDKDNVNSIGIWSVYIQMYITVCLLRYMKGKMK